MPRKKPVSEAMLSATAEGLLRVMSVCGAGMLAAGVLDPLLAFRLKTPGGTLICTLTVRSLGSRSVKFGLTGMLGDRQWLFPNQTAVTDAMQRLMPVAEITPVRSTDGATVVVGANNDIFSFTGQPVSR
jgi:hypothetical protein